MQTVATLDDAQRVTDAATFAVAAVSAAVAARDPALARRQGLVRRRKAVDGVDREVSLGGAEVGVRAALGGARADAADSRGHTDGGVDRDGALGGGRSRHRGARGDRLGRCAARALDNLQEETRRSRGGAKAGGGDDDVTGGACGQRRSAGVPRCDRGNVRERSRNRAGNRGGGVGALDHGHVQVRARARRQGRRADRRAATGGGGNVCNDARGRARRAHCGGVCRSREADVVGGNQAGERACRNSAADGDGSGGETGDGRRGADAGGGEQRNERPHRSEVGGSALCMWNEQGAKSAVSESVAGGESPGDNAACGAKGRSPPAHEVYNTAARVGATAVGAKGSVREQHQAEAIEDPHLYTVLYSDVRSRPHVVILTSY